MFQTVALLLACLAVHLSTSLPPQAPAAAELSDKLATVGDPDSVTCSDGVHYCEDGETCCYSTTYFAYKCCPYPRARCCYKGDSCCPQGTTCSSTGDKCYRADEEATEGENEDKSGSKMARISVPSVRSPSMKCADGRTECSASSTCCLMFFNRYGCCPIVHAECCDDGEHCCPAGYTCRGAAGNCERRDDSDASAPAVVPMLTKTPAAIVVHDEKDVRNIICPNHEECVNGDTCCSNNRGGYGCCPIFNAVCCGDGVHCCPYNLPICDVRNNHCYARIGHFSAPFVLGDKRIV